MTTKKIHKPNEKRWRYRKHINTHYYQSERWGYGHVFKTNDGKFCAATADDFGEFATLREAKAFVEEKVNRKRKRAAKGVK